MINLDVKEYCSNCSEFEPYVDRNIMEYEDFKSLEIRKEVNTIVSCVHKDRCKAITKFLERR